MPSGADGALLTIPEGGVSLTRAAAMRLVAQDLAAWTEDGGLKPTPAGHAKVRRMRAAEAPFRAQHGDLVRAPVDAGRGCETLTVDLAESPLAWLRQRRGRGGAPLVGDAAFAAGERLRADFTYGRLAPRVTASWAAPVARGRRSAGGATADLADSALAARQRVRAAVEAVGPELAGVLLDVCCFLKGLEDVERDRRWPVRSAKIVLGLALDRLARHYGLADKAIGGRAPGRIEHWGAPGYRPTIDG